jgi:pimeloyl-ACP methyl ester carboxylesterase
VDDLQLEGFGEGRVRVVVEGDPQRQPVALVFPGLRYSPARPLLHYTRKLLRVRGWSVVEAWYAYDTPEFLEARESERFERIAADAVGVWRWSRERGEVRMLVGKSIGTLAMAALAAHAAAAREAAKVWLTPLLRQDDVLASIVRDAAPGLAVCGGADPATPAELIERLDRPGLHTLVLKGAGHGLEVEDPLRSLDLMRDYLEALDAFLGVL